MSTSDTWGALGKRPSFTVKRWEDNPNRPIPTQPTDKSSLNKQRELLLSQRIEEFFNRPPPNTIRDLIRHKKAENLLLNNIVSSGNVLHFDAYRRGLQRPIDAIVNEASYLTAEREVLVRVEERNKLHRPIDWFIERVEAHDGHYQDSDFAQVMHDGRKTEDALFKTALELDHYGLLVILLWYWDHKWNRKLPNGLRDLLKQYPKAMHNAQHGTELRYARFFGETSNRPEFEELYKTLVAKNWFNT